MRRDQIEAHLEMHVLNMCLAAIAGREGDVRECKNLLAEKVYDMIEHEVKRALAKG